MNNTIFFISYVLLTLVVMGTVMAVLNLYSSQPHSARAEWLLGKVQRGQRLPNIFVGIPDTGFVHIISSDADAITDGITGLRIALLWDHQYTLLHPSQDISYCHDSLPQPYRINHVEVSDHELRSLQPKSKSVIAFIERERVLETADASYGLSELVRRFEFFAAPNTEARRRALALAGDS